MSSFCNDDDTVERRNQLLKKCVNMGHRSFKIFFCFLVGLSSTFIVVRFIGLALMVPEIITGGP